jgi:hypothetical protein
MRPIRLMVKTSAPNCGAAPRPAGDDDADQEAHQPDDAERADADHVEALDHRVERKRLGRRITLAEAEIRTAPKARAAVRAHRPGPGRAGRGQGGADRRRERRTRRGPHPRRHGYAWDPAWLAELKNRPGFVLMLDGQPVMMHLEGGERARPTAPASPDRRAHRLPQLFRAAQARAAVRLPLDPPTRCRSSARSTTPPTRA